MQMRTGHTGYLYPCPVCGIPSVCDDGHRVCLVCEGRACREHGRLDMQGRCAKCEERKEDA